MELFDAMRDIGFVTLINHGIPEQLHNKAYAESIRFFTLPQERKQEHVVTDPAKLGMGYVGVEEEHLDSRIPDLKENFSIVGPMITDEDALWPHALPEFRSTMLELYRRNDALRADILRCLSMAMGLGEEYFTPFFDGQSNVLRLLRYPECEKGAISADGQKRAGVHSDYGVVTLLHQRGGGLHACRRDGEWIFVPPVPGGLVVNVGDCLMRWSNDVLRSTPHCVMGDPRIPEGSIEPERYSLVFFTNPSKDVTVECLPTCASDESPPKYAPINAHEYVVGRIRSRMAAAAPSSAAGGDIR